MPGHNLCLPSVWDLPPLIPKRICKDMYVLSQRYRREGYDEILGSQQVEKHMMKFWGLLEGSDPSWGKETKARNTWTLLWGGWGSREKRRWKKITSFGDPIHSGRGEVGIAEPSSQTACTAITSSLPLCRQLHLHPLPGASVVPRAEHAVLRPQRAVPLLERAAHCRLADADVHHPMPDVPDSGALF